MGYKSPRQYILVIVYVNAHHSSQNLYWFWEETYGIFSANYFSKYRTSYITHTKLMI